MYPLDLEQAVQLVMSRMREAEAGAAVRRLRLSKDLPTGSRGWRRRGEVSRNLLPQPGPSANTANAAEAVTGCAANSEPG